MNQQEFFDFVVGNLETMQIPYMVAGSVAAISYGEPRLTNDIDLVVELPERRVDEFLHAFGAKEFYLPPIEVIQNEIKQRGQFNVVHLESGSKADFILRKDTPFAEMEFSRKVKIPFSESVDCQCASVEDVILSKLNFFRIGKSQKHVEDIKGIFKISGEILDRKYLLDWIEKLKLSKEWEACEIKET